MHTTQVLHKLLCQSVPSIHASRLKILLLTVQALTHGARATVTAMGRGLTGSAFDKHKIKRVDRLLSNSRLYRESHTIYGAMTRRLLLGLSEVVISIDWSPLCADQSWHLLRAAIPVGGRSLTLYEEVHPQKKLGNRKVQHRFLDQLALMLPGTCHPVIVADSGFRTPFFHYIEKHFDWHWVGRIRGQDFICFENRPDQWFSAKALHTKATTKAKCCGVIDWVRKHPLPAWIVLIRLPKKRRQALTYQGNKRQSFKDKVHIKRAGEPWLLVASMSLQMRGPRQIVKIYKTRMQIEEGFRDCKSVHYGLSLSQNRRINVYRRTVLCLIAACAIFVLWCIGTAGKQTDIARQVRVNSSSKRSSYSVIFLSKLLIAQPGFRIPDKAIYAALLQIKTYMGTVLCE